MLMASCVLFASRRRHTRCALVTGVQTCALPIAGWKFNDLIRVPSAACPSQRAVVRVWRKPVVVGEERDGQGQARIYLVEALNPAAAGKLPAIPMYAAAMSVEGEACNCGPTVHGNSTGRGRRDRKSTSLNYSN